MSERGMGTHEELRRDWERGITEKEFLGQIVTFARALGYMVYHTHDSRRSEPGFPDLVMASKKWGKIIYAEIKTSTGKITAAQDEWIRTLVHAGAEVYVWRPRNWNDIIEALGDKPAPGERRKE